MVTNIGGARPWLARYASGQSTQPDPFMSLGQAQATVEASWNRPLRWRREVDPEGVPTLPETWYAEDFASPGVVQGGKGPWVYTPGSDLVVELYSPDGVTPETVHLDADPALADATVSGPYLISPSDSWSVTLSRPSAVSVIPVSTGLSPSMPLSAEDAAVWLNSNALPPGSGVVFQADGTSNTLQIASVAGGSGVSISAVGGGTLATSLGFTTPVVSASGVGNVPDNTRITVGDAVNLLNHSSLDWTSGVSVQAALLLATKGVGSAYALRVLTTASTMTFGFDGSLHRGVN